MSNVLRHVIYVMVIGCGSLADCDKHRVPKHAVVDLASRRSPNIRHDRPMFSALPHVRTLSDHSPVAWKLTNVSE